MAFIIVCGGSYGATERRAGAPRHEHINENVLEPELILYSRAEDIFYPIENGQTYQCGEYEIDILYNEQGNFELSVTYQGGDEKS